MRVVVLPTHAGFMSYFHLSVFEQDVVDNRSKQENSSRKHKAKFLTTVRKRYQHLISLKGLSSEINEK